MCIRPTYIGSNKMKKLGLTKGKSKDFDTNYIICENVEICWKIIFSKKNKMVVKEKKN
jgi:hypothetical protein